MLDVLGGIRSACTYVGAGKLKEMSKRTTFIRFFSIFYLLLTSDPKISNLISTAIFASAPAVDPRSH